ncbi:hypothetical protein EDD68_10762 [Melghiribacillus thermohalophilus]|uniref:Uncharacterized protein n=1 Tax=Melghiribacillus thermohalophilus TaxID=1324956 RepID=A0A4R3N2M3_9BACI|nr:hypothetical protein [Melghiribacillus thermohalophilus]TCT23348.1 hypothetical protein EDD68_10762 [Melghiribacillus thermohalophilus]
MQKLIKKLYDELYSPKLTPEELLNNIKHDNYISVNFSREDGKIIGITKCYLKNGLLAEYKYVFDNEKKLIKLSSNICGEEEIIYDRDTAIKKIYKEIKLKKSSLEKAI